MIRSVLAEGGVVRCLAVPGGRNLSRRELDELALLARGAGAKGLTWVPGPLDKHLTEGELAAIRSATKAGPDDLVLVVADRRRKAETVMGLLRREIARRRELIPDGQWKFTWIYPMYLFEEDDQGKLTYGHHPFTSPWPEDMGLIDDQPYRVRARAYDCVLNGIEIAGGSIRIHDRGLQERVFEVLGMSRERIQAQFGHLLDAFDYGVPPHGGIAHKGRSAPEIGLVILTLLPTGRARVRVAQQTKNRDPGVRTADQMPAREPHEIFDFAGAPRRDLESQGRGPT